MTRSIAAITTESVEEIATDLATALQDRLEEFGFRFSALDHFKLEREIKQLVLELIMKEA